MNKKMRWADMTFGQRVIYFIGIAYIIAIYLFILFIAVKIAIHYV